MMMKRRKSDTFGPYGFDRREFLIGGGSFLLWLAAGQCSGSAMATGTPKFSIDPFSLGIASGDPTADGVVLWTRLAPDPLNGGGMPPAGVPVEWQVASDDQMQHVMKSGTSAALPDLAHSVHVEVRGLQPARPYWYQFRTGAYFSPIGRTRTAPAPGSHVDKLTFAFASCQNYEDGYYTAHRHMASEELDLVVFLGDYIYEGKARPGRTREHKGAEIMTLNDYRNRYALYKSDPDLQQAHAAFPWVVATDDHEVDNNYAGAVDQDGSPPKDFLRRRAAAYHAYYEHMPLRLSSLPKGAHMRLYRRLDYGSLAEFSVLDTRQYRTDQPCGDGHKERCAEAFAARSGLLGPAQERWLLSGLNQSRARWNVLAQQVMMSQTIEVAGTAKKYGMDNWNGYVAARARLLNFIQQRRPSNPVVLTGDIHSSWVCDVKADFDAAKSPTIATEFVGTSISSGGDGGINPQAEADRRLAANSHLKFFNAQRGYVRCALSPTQWQSDYRVVDAVSRRDAAMTTLASFVVENGRAGAQRK
ncbi:MAG: alkaline phosphatase D family protein [Pyrinomonadaceae bacterium]